MHPYSRGLSYVDPHKRTPDLGITRCYDGQYITTWGLNLTADNLLSSENYVWHFTYPLSGKVKTFERIICKIN